MFPIKLLEWVATKKYRSPGTAAFFYPLRKIICFKDVNEIKALGFNYV